MPYVSLLIIVINISRISLLKVALVGFHLTRVFHDCTWSFF